MIQRMFQHRSGRIIALNRTLLAALFTLTIWQEPAEPLAFSPLAPFLLLAFTAVSVLLMALTWNNWWLEARLAAPAHVLDLVVFTVVVTLTAGYASPFFGIFIFLVLSAAIRWGWRAALATTMLVLLLFFAAGLVAANQSDAGTFQMQRFFVRGTNLVVLSLMIIWFGVNQYGMRPGRGRSSLTDDTESAEPPVRQSLDHAMRGLRAGRAVFAWSESEEPWLHVATLEDGRLREERLGPDAFGALVADDLEDRSFLFDVNSSRLLVRGGGRNLLRRRASVDVAFAARFGVGSGVVIPMRAEGYQGHIFATDIPGLCSDDVPIAERLGEEISSAFGRVALFAATQEAATTRTRLLLARDLHDSVVQFHAGLSLKLQGIKMAAQEGASVDRELDELQRQLAQEQRDLRALIGALREPSQSSRGVNLATRIATLCRRLERQWGIACETATTPRSIEVRPQLQHNVDQLIREAVANAVRHGSASRISVKATVAADHLHLDVQDDGDGFPTKGEFGDAELREKPLGPRSLQERVHNLGGKLMLATSEQGSRLAIALPLRGSTA